MNFRKNLTILTVALGLTVSFTMMQSCKKDDNSSPAKMTLYDSLGGTTKVNAPANAGQMIEKGRLGLRSVVDSTIFVIAGDNKLNGFFTTLLAEVGNNNLT